MSDYRGIISSIIGVLTLGSVFIYIHKRGKIPKLAFDGYFKTEQEYVTGNVPSKVTIYCVRIEDVNANSEGMIKSCVGSLTVGSQIYRATWMSVDRREYTFVKEAWLKLFDVDSRGQTIGLFSDGKRSVGSIGRLIGDNVTIQLKAGRGRCPSSKSENIEYIIKNAQPLHSQS